MEEINIGIVGHIDHGKTTLLSALTGKYADTHSEELKRGITIKLGYSEMIIYDNNGKLTFDKETNGKKNNPLKYVSFIDTPGHEMLMATMLSGAAIIDAAIIVIAANEGIKPQTKEHFMALQAKNVKKIIIVQNKIDLVSKEEAIKNYHEIKKFLKGTIAENSIIIPISAQQKINIEKILEELNKINSPERDIKSLPVFLIARSFDINKPGTEIKNLRGGVLGGILKKGILKKGDEIEIKPGINLKKSHGKIEYKTLKTKIISIFRGKQELEEATPGASISIETSLDPFITKTDSLTGCVASKKGNLPEIDYEIKFKSNLFKEFIFSEETKKIEEIKINERLMLSINTTITLGEVKKINKEEIEISLNIPVIVYDKDNLGIARNINNHWRLIGWGEIIKN